MRCLLCVLALALLLQGCATVFKGSNELLTIQSDPPGARVIINGLEVGTSPAAALVNGTKNQTILLVKDGYESRTVFVTSSIGAGWVIADVIFGFWPLVIDAATGNWKSLDESAVFTVLEKK
ncbi:MAG: PEGA domain-containing protein [Candidatus Kapabacteria bacterium]|nr:PEGA domain-containing protein [Candidatus Kapabacteria bacterium]